MPGSAARRPPEGAHSWVLLVLDSCRYDSFTRAKPKHMTALGAIERRYAYASWTAPSHYNLLLGLMPHPNAARSFSADIYRAEYLRFRDRLGVDLDFADLLPELWLPSLLHERGWHTGAWVSLPVLHPATPLSRGFDHYQLRPRSNDLRGIIEDLRFYEERPSFWLINAGETHYPYHRPDRPAPDAPRLSGLHGALKTTAPGSTARFFTASELRELHDRQVEAVRYVDEQIALLRELVPDGTWLTVTADHGECFGEGGFFGHGPVSHPRVFEVPFVEGRLR